MVKVTSKVFIAYNDNGGSTWALGTQPPSVQLLFHFSYSFSAKIVCQIIGWRVPSRVGTPIWEIMDPPLHETRKWTLYSQFEF